VIGDLQARATGSVFDTIIRSTFDTVPFVRPLDPAAAVFEEFVAPAMDRIRMNVEESHTLATIRDALVPGLLSGEVSLKQAEGIVTEVV
jgi:type I restriction enzyme S subunit